MVHIRSTFLTLIDSNNQATVDSVELPSIRTLTFRKCSKSEHCTVKEYDLQKQHNSRIFSGGSREDDAGVYSTVVDNVLNPVFLIQLYQLETSNIPLKKILTHHHHV